MGWVKTPRSSPPPPDEKTFIKVFGLLALLVMLGLCALYATGRW